MVVVPRHVRRQIVYGPRQVQEPIPQRRFLAGRFEDNDPYARAVRQVAAIFQHDDAILNLAFDAHGNLNGWNLGLCFNGFYRIVTSDRMQFADS
jgi:hypothetical protein